MQKVCSWLILMSLLFWSTPLALHAQSQPDSDDDAGSRMYLPLVTQGTTNNPALPTEEEAPESEQQSASLGAEALLAGQRGSQQRPALPTHVAALRLQEPLRHERNEAAAWRLPLAQQTGRQQVVVRLRAPSVVQHVLANVAASSATAQQAQAAVVQQQQTAVVAAALQLDANTKVLGQVQKALNAVMLEIDATALATLAANPAVQSIRPVVNYTLALTETVPYIGGTAVHGLGYDGDGVRVAVLDSGIDYTHANLGGAGTQTAYEAAYGVNAADPLNTTLDGLFPTAKVVDGYDFVGESWPTTNDLAPDPDPIDFEGHGTHVADIIGGVRGVAPAADLYAVKVCSAVATSCSGVALLQGMDFALDPNGDDSMADAVDIINMSLGSDYGSPADDDLALAAEFASAYGVIVVASAGNGGDKPYIHGTPAGAPSALAVAQTQVPSAQQPIMAVTEPITIAGQYDAIFQSWSVAPTTIISGPVQYGDGAGGNLNGCAAFTPGSLTGKVVLVNRGSCNFTLKISNISEGGGLIGLIGLIAAGAPFPGADGGERPIAIPGYMISQSVANLLKSQLANGAVVEFDPNLYLPLVQSMAGSSSRGPSVGSNRLKPDIGAPGASISAIAGAGTGEGSFGGTSGAAPMVAGAAALLRQKYPTYEAHEIKALLMNTAETNILNQVLIGGNSPLAPVSRIGGGEVRVDRAATAQIAAWDTDSQMASLTFAFQDVSSSMTLRRLVTVRNYALTSTTYLITPTFRFADDAANGAVQVTAPARIFVPARGEAQFEVRVRVTGAALRPWSMNSGAAGANPALLTLHEYDGYLWLTKANDSQPSIHLPWHILPRGVGNIGVNRRPTVVRLHNRGAFTSTVESYSLIGTSANLPQGGPGDNNPIPDYRYLGYFTYAAPPGECSNDPSFVLAFAANTWERQSHAITPASYALYLDTDQDGFDDYLVLTRDSSLNNFTDGRNLTWVVDLATDDAAAWFYTDHETNSSNTVMYICAEQIGMTGADVHQPIDLTAWIDDFYFGDEGDVISGITFAPYGEQYVAEFTTHGNSVTELAPGTTQDLRVVNYGPLVNNSERGLLLLFRDGAPINREAGTVVILP